MKKITFLVVIIVVMFSRSSSNKESSNSSADINKEIVDIKNSDKSYGCLKKYQEDYKGLLSRDEITSVYPVDFAIAEEELRSVVMVSTFIIGLVTDLLLQLRFQK